MHFFSKKFAYIKKKLYLCSRFRKEKEPNSIFNILTIKIHSQITI